MDIQNWATFMSLVIFKLCLYSHETPWCGPSQMAHELQPCTEAFMLNALFVAVFSETPGGVQRKYSVNKLTSVLCYHFRSLFTLFCVLQHGKRCSEL